MDATVHSGIDQPTAPMKPPAPGGGLISAPGGEGCANCGATLAADQRYCLECGERRGKARFSLGPLSSSRATGQTRVVRRRMPLPAFIGGQSASTSLIAGIATLLLAMGVGVLIGKNNASNAGNRASTPVQVVTVAGGGAATPAASGAAAAPAANPAASRKRSKSKPRSGVQSSQPAVITTVKNLPPPKVQVGAACKPGTAGCSPSGKFTGDFFGN